MKLTLFLIYSSHLLARGHGRLHETGFADGHSSGNLEFILFVVGASILYGLYGYIKQDTTQKKQTNLMAKESLHIMKEGIDELLHPDKYDDFNADEIAKKKNKVDDLTKLILPVAVHPVKRHKPVSRVKIKRPFKSYVPSNTEDITTSNLMDDDELERINQLFQEANAYDMRDIVLDVGIPSKCDEPTEVDTKKPIINNKQLLIDSDLDLLEELRMKNPEIKTDRLYWEIIMSDTESYTSRKNEIVVLFNDETRRMIEMLNKKKYVLKKAKIS